MPNPEFDFQRPDNPNRIYSTHRVIASLAFLVNNIAAKTIYTDISATIVMPEPGIGDDPKYGLDIDGKNEYRDRLVRIATGVTRILELAVENKTAQEFKKYEKDVALRLRTRFGRKKDK